MKIFFQNLYFVFIIMFCFACQLHHSNVDRFGIRNDFQAQLFKNQYKLQIHALYQGLISSDTIQNQTFVQFDTVRVYLLNQTKTYKGLFEKGLLSGQLFYYDHDTICAPLQSIKIQTPQSSTYYMNWKGHSVGVDRIELLHDVHASQTQRRYKIAAHRIEMGNYYVGNIVYYMELTNPHATRFTSFKTFINGATMTYFIRFGMKI
jgi:hypothetical protein